MVSFDQMSWRFLEAIHSGPMVIFFRTSVKGRASPSGNQILVPDIYFGRRFLWPRKRCRREVLTSKSATGPGPAKGEEARPVLYCWDFGRRYLWPHKLIQRGRCSRVHPPPGPGPVQGEGARSSGAGEAGTGNGKEASRSALFRSTTAQRKGAYDGHLGA